MDTQIITPSEKKVFIPCNHNFEWRPYSCCQRKTCTKCGKILMGIEDQFPPRYVPRAKGGVLVPAGGGGDLGGGSGEGGGCVAQQTADILAETFIGSANGGYSTAGWTTSASAPDANADTTSLSTSKPNAACNEGFRTNVAANSEKWAVWNINRGASSTVYCRTWFYIASHSVSNESYSPVFFATRYDSTSYDVVSMQLRNLTATGLHLYVGGVDTYASIGAITTGAWHRLDVTSVSGGTSVVSVDGVQARSWSADNNYNNYVMIGMDGTIYEAIDMYFYQLFVNTLAF